MRRLAVLHISLFLCWHAGGLLAQGVCSLPVPAFSHPHGFYEAPFAVEITAKVPDAQIFYTTDGSEPGEVNAARYTAPVSITTTTVLRAIVKTDSLTSNIVTVTYLFLGDVIKQPSNPPGYPAEWGPYTAIPGTAIADYGMDGEILRDPRYKDLMKEALLSIPTLSIVTDRANLFSKSNDPDSGGIYIYTGAPGDNDAPQLGDGWERPASVEFFNRDGSEEFQIDCGIQLQGGHSRRPEKSPKHSFRLVFKSKYGPTKLNYPLFGDDVAAEFNTITLRAGFGNTWHHWNSSERQYAQYQRDVWAKDTQLAMGHPAGHGRYVHLYLNGLYWGVYNPTERIDKEFAAAYLSGNADDYDVIKDYGDVVDGTKTAWNKMMSLANNGLADNISYQRIQGKNPDGTANPNYEAYVDVVNLIDYMILNFYGGNWDWDHHNWVAVRNRVQPGKGFKFFSWDAEHVLEDIYSNLLNENNYNCPSRLFQQLRANVDFRRLFADRVQLHCFNGGVLTSESAKARWMARADQIDLAIIAESARWGDYRRDVHRYLSSPFELYDKAYWLAQQSFLINQYFPQRTNEFIAQLKQANLFPQANAPRFLINGHPIAAPSIQAGDMLSMIVTAGTIYYTLDGADPVTNGQASLQALVYSKPIILIRSTHAKARTYLNGEWSALNEQLLVLPTDIHNLKITEIHYHPLPADSIDDRSFEFIELKNIGAAPLDLSGLQFCDGISFSFPMRAISNPNEFFVLASDQFYFARRYGFAPDGEYDGFLDNAGERIVMITAAGDTILSARYDDRTPWPEAADGAGYSLVLKDPNANSDPNNPDNWRSSHHIHGSPGDDDTPTNIAGERLPSDFRLWQNYPNPFNATTVISFQVPVASHVTLKVYDMLGREVETLVNEIKQPGIYHATFSVHKLVERRLDSLSSGLYIYRFQAGDFLQARKMILIK